MKRIVSISVTLSEDEVHRALVAFAMQDAPDEVRNAPMSGPNLKWSVSVSERTGEAEVSIRYEQEVEVAP